MKVIPTSFCTSIQREYERLHGSLSKGCRQELPRRITERRRDPGSLASLKRKREEQLQHSSSAVAEVGAEAQQELEVLEGIAQEAAAKRHCKQQESLAHRLTKYAEKKRKQCLEDAAPPGSNKQKLKEHQKAAAAKLQDLQDLQRRSMSVILTKPSLPLGSLVIATTRDAEAAVHTCGGAFQLWPDRPADCVEVAKQVLSGGATVWLCSAQEEHLMMLPNDEYSTFTAAARLLGGKVANPYWLRASSAEGRLLDCCCALQRGLDVPQQLCYHKSLEKDQRPVAKALGLATQAASEAGLATRWCVHQKQKHLLLGCKLCAFCRCPFVACFCAAQEDKGSSHTGFARCPCEEGESDQQAWRLWPTRLRRSFSQDLPGPYALHAFAGRADQNTTSG